MLAHALNAVIVRHCSRLSLPLKQQAVSTKLRACEQELSDSSASRVTRRTHFSCSRSCKLSQHQIDLRCTQASRFCLCISPSCLFIFRRSARPWQPSARAQPAMALLCCWDRGESARVCIANCRNLDAWSTLWKLAQGLSEPPFVNFRFGRRVKDSLASKHGRQHCEPAAQQHTAKALGMEVLARSVGSCSVRRGSDIPSARQGSRSPAQAYQAACAQ